MQVHNLSRMAPAFGGVIDQCQVLVGTLPAFHGAAALESVRALVASLPSSLTLREQEQLRSVITRCLARLVRDRGWDNWHDVTKALVVTASTPSCERWREALDESLRKLVEVVSEDGELLESAGSVKAPASVRRALRFIDQRYGDPNLSLPQVAEHVWLTVWHVARLLKEHTGEGFTSIVRCRRATEARKLLHQSSAPLKEIASVVGFGHASHFSRSYKLVYGLSPRQCRRRHLQRRCS